jgi:hypothetical protein
MALVRRVHESVASVETISHAGAECVNWRYADAMRTFPTAPVAGGSLIAGYAVAASSGSRPLGGVMLAAGGLWCAAAWTRRHGGRAALELVGAMFGAFVLSHLLALAVGAWPSVLLLALGTATVVWLRADTHELQAG